MNLSKFVQFRVEPYFNPILDHLTYINQHGIAKGFKRKGGLGFLPLQIKPTKEEALLAKLDLKGKTVYDVGAAIGLVMLFLAHRVGPEGKVIAFEPNPALYARACENASLNHLSNVRILPMALGDRHCKDVLVYSFFLKGVGSLAKDEKKRMLQLRDERQCIVTVESIDNLRRSAVIPEPNFIKIDVQGYERNVLLGAQSTIRTHKPDMLIEVHSVPHDRWREDNLTQIIRGLIWNGYHIMHVESGKEAAALGSEDFQPDEHLYCSYDASGS